MKPLSQKYQTITPSITLAINAKAKAMKSEGKDVLSFASGEPDFNTPKHIREKAIHQINQGGNGYTAAKGLKALREAIQHKLKHDNHLEYDVEDIIVSNGAKHSIFNALQAIINPTDEVIQISPYWVSYPEMIKMAGGVPITLKTSKENAYIPTEDALKKVITDQTKAIIINTPNNPTGMVYPKETLNMIGALAVKHDFYIISDEIYEKLIYEGTHHSIASFTDELFERTITINGLSKAYAMTGWRIGYAAAPKMISAMMNAIQSHATSNPNTIAQHDSIEGLKGDQTPIESMRQSFEKRRQLMLSAIEKIPNISAIKPSGAFYVMFDIRYFKHKTINGKKIMSSTDFAEVLLDEAYIASVPGKAFGEDNLVRLSYATSEQTIEKGMNRLHAFCEKYR